MNIAIIGSGVYALAIAHTLSNSGNKVTVWTEKENPKEVIVPEKISVTNDFKTCLNCANLVFVLTTAKYTKDIFIKIKEYITKDMIIILGSKGILNNGITIEELLNNIIPNSRYAIISGPTFACDIANLEPVGFTIATKEISDYNIIKKVFKNNTYLEYSSDTKGVEYCGVLKNIYAIGSGMLESFNYGPSTRILYIYKALNEIKHIISSLNSFENTSITLAGIGDLVLTCTSLNSRNFTFGNIVGCGTKEEKVNYIKNNTIEGLDNLNVLYELFKEKSIDTPILNKLYNIIYNNASPEDIISYLLH